MDETPTRKQWACRLPPATIEIIKALSTLWDRSQADVIVRLCEDAEHAHMLTPTTAPKAAPTPGTPEPIQNPQRLRAAHSAIVPSSLPDRSNVKPFLRSVQTHEK